MTTSSPQPGLDLISKYDKKLLKLFAWAKDEGFLSTLEVLYYVLGLQSCDPSDATIANLADEVTREYSSKTLQEWSVTPEVREIIRVSNSFIGSSVANSYPAIIPTGSAKQISAQFRNYTTHTYLLAMLANQIGRAHV